MKSNISEISSILKQEIASYKNKLDVSSVGRVVEVGDGIARIYGLDNAMSSEMLRFENDVRGEVFNLEEDSIGAVIYGDYTSVKEGSDVYGTGQVLSVPVGPELIGRIVNPLCEPIDGKAPITSPARRFIESEAPNMSERQPVKQPLQTGIKSIDSMIPIGKARSRC